MPSTPTLFIFTGAHQVTGALIAACHEAEMLKADARVSIILSSRSDIVSSDLPGDPQLLYLPLAMFSRQIGDLVRYPFALLRSGWALKRALNQAGCRHLQVNDFYFAEGFVARLLGFHGRLVTWIRIDPRRYGRAGGLWLRMARWSSNRLVAVSRFIRGGLPDGFPAVIVYEPAPDVEAAPRAPGQRLLFLGNYTEGKGQDMAIRAFHRIAHRFPQAELVFHGSDMGLAKNRRYRDRLTTLAQAGDGAGRIHVLDFVADPAPLYRSAFAALNFSRSESFSMTCLEASAHGLPVVATRSGGPQEIIEEATSGYLVPVGDIETMAARIADLLADPAAAAEMGRRGRTLVGERFSPARFREQMLDLLDLQ